MIPPVRMSRGAPTRPASHPPVMPPTDIMPPITPPIVAAAIAGVPTLVR